MATKTISKPELQEQVKTKTCFKCGGVKPLSEFYKHPQMTDGRVNKCKACNKKDVSTNYRKNITYYKKYEQDRNTKRWGYKAEQTKRWRKNNPEKYKAQCAVNNAVRDGRLKKQSCLVCASEKVHAHHDDYSKPLEVLWLCAQHHRDLHKAQRLEAG